MLKIGRNDPCPCGSGKKFKKCHMNREEELLFDGMGEISEQMSAMITGLPEVDYGRSREIAGNLDINALTGNDIGIRFVDLKRYTDLDLFGGAHRGVPEGRGGGLLINPYKTMKTDSKNLYLAISPGVDDSTLAHQLAHVLDYLGGSRKMPGTLGPLAFELGIPSEHLEHTEEFGRQLDYLAKRFRIQLDADDTIIVFLYENGMLIRVKDIDENNRMVIKAKSDRIFRFLSEKSSEIDTLIRDLPGYIGPREAKDSE